MRGSVWGWGTEAGAWGECLRVALKASSHFGCGPSGAGSRWPVPAWGPYSQPSMASVCVCVCWGCGVWQGMEGSQSQRHN